MKTSKSFGADKKRTLLALSAAALLMVSAPAAAFAETSAGTAAAAESASGQDPAKAVTVNTAVTKEKAESLARGYVSIPKDFKLQNVNLYTQLDLTNRRNVWNLNFNKTVNGTAKGNISVSIDADNGDLLSYQAFIDNPNAKPSYPLKVNRDAAKQAALSFIGQVSPKYKDQIRFDEDFGADAKPPLTGLIRHSLRFDRVVGDIAYMDNYIDVEVDSEGHVLSYNVVWDGTIDFGPLKPSFPLQEATAKLRAAAVPELAYVVPYRSNSPIQPLLVYTMNPVTIDAVSGETVAPPVSQSTADAPLADRPLSAEPAGGLNLTREKAEQAVRAAFPIPDNATLANASYNENKDERSGTVSSSWNLAWTLKDGDKEVGNLYAAVDSETGTVRNFGQYRYQPLSGQNAGSRTSYSDAKAKAADVAKKQLPWLADQWYAVEPDAKEIEQMDKNPDLNAYSFGFVRKAGGARIASDNLRIDIDAHTGNVQNYWAEVSSIDYPEQTPAVISKERALDAWMKAYKTELTYVTETSYLYGGKPIPIDKYKLMLASGELSGEGQVKTEQSVKLVYRLVPKPLEESLLVDARTGQWLNAETGEVTELVKAKPTDIEGHWAQRELELMVAYHALDVADGKVRPNQVITRGELIKMLVLAINSGRPPIVFTSGSASAAFADVAKESAYYPYVQNALSQNLIDIGDGTFNPNGKVDREEMAELIARALGYNSLAEHDNLFNVTFRDAAETKQKGQAAIAVGLGIMTLSGGKFQPAREVTRAEAASAFSRFLSVRAELQEAPLRNG
ncbi:hypothetical protein GE107_24040 [Cohnella sp. CFH 77786]|uniref:S-layer homology domain-containing protein n=1 Tax=Cohnella sp. CFH 77786 TaxID=2662265 RepID=UPI001C6091B7|nr:hypothetical protein [Cohnella sp. CFH 77786]